eukprot:scaffold6.g2501.t1
MPPLAPKKWVSGFPVSRGVGVFGTKAGMMSFYRDGLALPATVIALEPGNMVTAVKSEEKDGYTAVQVGYKVVPERKLNKPELGHCSKAGAPPLKHLREFKVKDASGYEAGQQLDVEALFAVGDLVDVAGTTIGKGFQGGIKRWGFARGLMTHGSKSKREHGSTGPGSTPGRVFPGVKMPGHMGAVRAKIRKLEVLKVDKEKGAIVVKGTVPGKPGNLVEVAPSKRVQAEDVVKATALASLAGAFLGTGSVQAAMEVGQLAAGDGRTGTLFSLAIPVLAWAGYNIWGPASRQLENMNAKQAIAGAVGLGTAVSLLLAPEADAATEAMQLAAGDGRFGILTTIVLIALGWVTFQILGPAQRQLENMNAKTGKGKRAVAGAIGLGAASSLLLAPNADAAEIMQLAANDGRFGILTTIVLIALGWVGFQILGPAQRQLENMNAKTGKTTSKRK